VACIPIRHHDQRSRLVSGQTFGEAALAGPHDLEMTPGELWLATLWPLVRDRLPAPPARVVDIGCGPLGGFAPILRPQGYDAVGIDPQAPEEPHYLRIEFERA